jgi:hypothetical protein
MSGSKELVASIKTYLNSAENKGAPWGESEFLFNRSFPMLRGIYRAEHGSFELSHKDGICILEKWDKVCEFVSMAYSQASSDDATQECRKNGKPKGSK